MGILRILTDFPFGLIIAQFLFAFYYPRRRRFWLRALGTAIPFWIIYAMLAQQSDEGIMADALQKILLFLILILTMVWVGWSYKCSFNEIIYCTVCAYAMQNIHYHLNINLQIFLEEIFNFTFEKNAAFLFGAVVMVVVYSLGYIIFIRLLKDVDVSKVDRTRVLINGVFLILMTMLFVVPYPEVFSLDRIMNFIYYMAADVLILFIQFGLVKEGSQSVQIEIMEQMLNMERKQHEISKETIDIINMKCHDLKHQVSKIRKGGTVVSNDVMLELENAIQIYDSALQSGNDALDLVLMEKMLYCEKYNIQLTCIADGEKLNFIKSSDIYSLFGNALDNAIESVIKEKDEEKRLISFCVGSRDKMVSIHIENYYDGALLLKDGLPITTKQDIKYHGFGMMSIRHICNKYGGELSISKKDCRFILNIFIPVP